MKKLEITVIVKVFVRGWLMQNYSEYDLLKQSLVDFKQQLDYLERFANAGSLSQVEVYHLLRYENTLDYYRKIYHDRNKTAFMAIKKHREELDQQTYRLMRLNESHYG